MARSCGRLLAFSALLLLLLRAGPSAADADGTYTADCAYPCLPPPVAPITTNCPPPPSSSSSYPPPPPASSYGGYPPPPGGYIPSYQPPNSGGGGNGGGGGSGGGGGGGGGGGFGLAPPPPNPILPWYPWYYRSPLPSAAAPATSSPLLLTVASFVAPHLMLIMF